MSADRILDIKDVPHSPGTSWDMTPIYNPLEEDFTWSHDGKPYTIPAKSTKEFPEFLARHFAKHLARKIVYSTAYAEIEEAAKGQLTPDTAKAVPVKRVEIMEAWLLNPTGKSPEEKGEIKEPSEEKKLEIRERRLENLARARLAKAKKK